MIGFLKGTIHSLTDTAVVLDVNGVGYEVHAAKSVLVSLGEVGATAALEIYTHVAEGILQLFGFKSAREKIIFLKLTSVSGIGPKSALNILSDTSIESLIAAITQGNVAALTKINGIGKKTAERLVVELKDKFKDEPQTTTSGAANDNFMGDARLNDVTNALISLGYAEFTARKIVKEIAVNDNDTVQTLIKKSLARM